MWLTSWIEWSETTALSLSPGQVVHLENNSGGKLATVKK
jgi:hypothetical protein